MGLKAVSAGSGSFGALISGTNDQATMVVGSGASLSASGSGSITATVNANLTGMVTSVGNVATVVTNANLTGPITSTGNTVSPLTQYNVLLGAGTGAIAYAAPSTAGYVLTDNGTGANPSFKADYAKVRTIGFSTTAAATGQQGAYVVVPVAGTITGWSIAANAGTCTVQTWKIAAGTAVPTVANSISTAGVSLATGTMIQSTTVTDFTTTTVAAGDTFVFYLSAASGVSLLDFQLQITVT